MNVVIMDWSQWFQALVLQSSLKSWQSVGNVIPILVLYLYKKNIFSIRQLITHFIHSSFSLSWAVSIGLWHNHFNIELNCFSSEEDFISWTTFSSKLDVIKTFLKLFSAKYKLLRSFGSFFFIGLKSFLLCWKRGVIKFICLSSSLRPFELFIFFVWQKRLNYVEVQGLQSLLKNFEQPSIRFVSSFLLL